MFHRLIRFGHVFNCCGHSGSFQSSALDNVRLFNSLAHFIQGIASLMQHLLAVFLRDLEITKVASFSTSKLIGICQSKKKIGQSLINFLLDYTPSEHRMTKG